ncbi:hypothetical protein SS50377_25317 [Spironucleus salmonicida]|uniref:Uncharacterized protein n=1 Tax=Spironucleus salmonicida TaxID=348837 RepID=V6LC44_9EUKA|nr:hypothetical protein SS50377_25317 [Spironucleus salmonicida]|eukprot:EST41803.1 Hypothetical protein SS50377_18636 [Spironucleus salmonicida]
MKNSFATKDNIKIDTYFIQSQQQRNLLTDLKTHIREIGASQSEYTSPRNKKLTASNIILQKQNIPIIQTEKLLKTSQAVKISPEVEEMRSLMLQQQSQIKDLKSKNLELQNCLQVNIVKQNSLFGGLAESEVQDSHQLKSELQNSLAREQKLQIQLSHIQDTLQMQQPQEYVHTAQQLSKELEIQNINLKTKYQELENMVDPDKIQNLQSIIQSLSKEIAQKDRKIIKMKEKYNNLKDKYLHLENNADQLQQLLQTDQTETQRLIKDLFQDIQQLKEQQQQKFKQEK